VSQHLSGLHWISHGSAWLTFWEPAMPGDVLSTPVMIVCVPSGHNSRIMFWVLSVSCQVTASFRKKRNNVYIFIKAGSLSHLSPKASGWKTKQNKIESLLKTYIFIKCHKHIVPNPLSIFCLEHSTQRSSPTPRLHVQLQVTRELNWTEEQANCLRKWFRWVCSPKRRVPQRKHKCGVAIQVFPRY